MKTVIYLMGVSGCGKTTIGKRLSSVLNIPFYDGDDFHSEANVQKMSSGIPLNDEDRKPWLESINAFAKNQNSSIVIACSALKQVYRTWLSQDLNCKFILLHGSFDLIHDRMKDRDEHFMPPELLQSQFDTLELSHKCKQVDINQNIEKITTEIVEILDKKDIGVVGMGVMGKNLARNLARNGFAVSLYNRRVEGQEENVAADIAKQYPEFKNASAYEDLAAFVDNLSTPRRILIMVPAGAAVDAVITQLKAHCQSGDVIIDGGNSFFKDTETRYADLQKSGIEFLGMGVSGGESGALNGPAIMPSCTVSAYEKVRPMLEAIAAKNKLDQSCCQRIGSGGSGHFVKMIHNGIEYAEMQILAEVYDLLKTSGRSNAQIAAVLNDWLATPGYNSYLLEITTKIVATQDDKGHIIVRILDQASNKGTGAWTSIEGIQLGVPFNIISSALYARYISNAKTQRTNTAAHFEAKASDFSIDLNELKSAYHCARILNHAQGFAYLEAAAERYNWKLDLSTIAQIWTGGCIIRSDLMFDFVDLLKNSSDILLSPQILEQVKQTEQSLSTICAKGIQAGVPLPTFTACVNYLHGIKQARSSANIIQAQRDFFGAHTYKVLGDPDGDSQHTNWEAL